MTSKLIPANPEAVMVIREPIPGITTFSAPFLRFGLIKIGGRATIVKMRTGTLAVFPGVALTPTVQSKVQELGGKVGYLIAPDIEHHIFLSSWSAAFPKALLLAPAGLPEKRAEANKTDKAITILPFHTVFTPKDKLTTKVSDEFDAEFEHEFVDAHPNKELVFCHKPSKTLIEADLMFNLPATEQYSKTGESAGSGWATKVFGALQNTRGEAKWQKRLQWYAISSGDRPGFNASVQRISGWGFENVVPCHGDVILGTGKEVFEKVFEWHLKGKGVQK